MLVVEYDARNGGAIPDGLVEEYVKQEIMIHEALKEQGGGDRHICTGGEVVVNGFRLAIVKGEIKANEICFLFKGEKIQANKYGNLESWPIGFCDIGMDLAGDILTYQVSKRKETKERS